MQGVRWSEEDLKAHRARLAGHKPVSAVPARAPTDAIKLGRDGVNGSPPSRDEPALGEPVEKSPTSSKPKRQHPEQDLQIAAVKWLHVALPPTWRVVHVPNGVSAGGKAAMIANSIRKAMGVRAGMTDLTLLGPGRYVVAEAKAGKGRLRPEQEEWRDWFLSIGVPWFVFRSIEELQAGCADAGVPLRVRAQ